ncbi:MAG TPA: DUF6350 family protein [Pseudonocardia sp.]|jgi:hypothetical protein|uniref:cell division protein PerM n=1 Tax=Pseudonocardia sp. TaxID=60912 RepID=UPI002F4253EF
MAERTEPPARSDAQTAPGPGVGEPGGARPPAGGRLNIDPDADGHPASDPQTGDPQTGEQQASGPQTSEDQDGQRRGGEPARVGAAPATGPHSGARASAAAAARRAPRGTGTPTRARTAPARAVGGRAPLERPADRVRAVAASTLASVTLSYLLMVLVAALAGLTAGAGPAVGGLFASAVPLWLAAHQVPLVLGGAPLGVLPLLPTVGILALVARTSGRTTARLGGRVREDATIVVATLTGAHASVAVLATALPADGIRATPWAALLGGGLVAAAGAIFGAFRVAGPPLWWSGAPEWARVGLAAARVGAAALCAAGALLLIAALLVGAEQLHWRFGPDSPDFEGIGTGLGVTLLSLGYLPNALLASVSWIAGPGVSIGAVTASPLFTTPGPLPPLPLMAVMPASRPPAWTVIVFVLPVVAGVLLGRYCRRAGPDPLARLCAITLAVGTVAAGAGVLASVCSGRLAGGPFDPVDIPATGLAAAVLGWLVVPALAVALLPHRLARLR